MSIINHAQERREKALALRRLGHTYAEIAAKLERRGGGPPGKSISAVRAAQLVQSAFRRERRLALGYEEDYRIIDAAFKELSRESLRIRRAARVAD